jgi:RNA polymerase sigma-70 factor (ECF subfamily)
VDFVERLKSGDARAYATLIARHRASMLRVATTVTRSRALAEDVVQETLLAIVRGLPGYEGRASLESWMFTILINAARARASREGRTVAVDDDALLDGAWPITAETMLLSEEARTIALRAVERLPPHQREVMRLRDLEGWTAEEVCAVLELNDVHQRVLLHRARARVRRVLAAYFDRAAKHSR